MDTHHIRLLRKSNTPEGTHWIIADRSTGVLIGKVLPAGGFLFGSFVFIGDSTVSEEIGRFPDLASAVNSVYAVHLMLVG